jgi:hypothetical protein
LAIFFAKPPAHLYSGKILKNFNFISMKFLKIALLTVALASIQSLYAQKQADIDWQIGLNTVPLYERIVDGSVENPFLPTPTNLFLVKRINNQKNNALRFSADLRFRREVEDSDFVFRIPYQLTVSLLAGYEKRWGIVRNTTILIGGQVNPILSLNSGLSDAINLPTNDFSVNFKSFPIYQINLSAITGVEYKFNDVYSLSLENALQLTQTLHKNGYLGIDYEFDGQSTGLIFGGNNYSITNIRFQPVHFLNLNINIQ